MSMMEDQYTPPLYPKQPDDDDGPLPNVVYCCQCVFWSHSARRTNWRPAMRRLGYWEGPFHRPRWWTSIPLCREHLVSIGVTHVPRPNFVVQR